MRAKTEIIRLATLRVPRPSPFGEYLVQQRIIDRFQLFHMLQHQDRVPQKLGACAVELGYAPRHVIEELYQRFCRDTGAQQDFETMVTEAFHREPELEIIYGSQDIDLGDLDA